MPRHDNQSSDFPTDQFQSFFDRLFHPDDSLAFDGDDDFALQEDDMFQLDDGNATYLEDEHHEERTAKGFSQLIKEGGTEFGHEIEEGLAKEEAEGPKDPPKTYVRERKVPNP